MITRIFQSRNEKKLQAKYNDDESTLSEGSSVGHEEQIMCKFGRMDVNRERRKSVFMRPIDIQNGGGSDTNTDKRSNMTDIKMIQTSMRNVKVCPKVIHRSKSDVDEISSSVSVVFCMKW